MDKTHQILIMREIILLRPQLMFTPLPHFSEAQQCTHGTGEKKKTLIWVFLRGRFTSIRSQTKFFCQLDSNAVNAFI